MVKGKTIILLNYEYQGGSKVNVRAFSNVNLMEFFLNHKNVKLKKDDEPEGYIYQEMELDFMEDENDKGNN